jgi:hypothetical protein
MVSEVEKNHPYQSGDIFQALPPEKSQIMANYLSYVETTYGDQLACKICLSNTPIQEAVSMPSEVISSVHEFIIKYGQNRTEQPLNYHHRGQLSDYFDADSGWDMADVIKDGLRTPRKNLVIYLHGLIDGDDRAFAAAEKLQRMSEREKMRLDFIISTDPFGPCGVPDDEAEEIGLKRTLNALRAFHGMPRVTLYMLYADGFTDRKEQLFSAWKHFGEYMPKNYDFYRIVSPTRVKLPGNIERPMLEFCSGFGIHIDGKVVMKEFNGPATPWEQIGNMSDLDAAKIRQPLTATI